MSSRRVYVLGGGVAGLAAATALCEHGIAVSLIEAAPQAGGRCRSFFDKQLGCEIDNGNHLVLSGNTDTMRYLRRVDAMDTIDTLPAIFSFHDVAADIKWKVALGKGRVPWRLLCPHHGVPGTRLIDFWRSRALFNAGPDDTVSDTLGATGGLYERFWKPFAIAVLNTEPEAASAMLLKPVIEETLMKGGVFSCPVLTKNGLGTSFVDPALIYMREHGAEVSLGKRCRDISVLDGMVCALNIEGEMIDIGADDIVISALPPGILGELVPDISVPDDFRSIINVHFDTEINRDPGIVGIMGGLAEWVFFKGRIVSVTISAAEHVVDDVAGDIAARVWREIASVLSMDPDVIPRVRVIKEKRATFAQTPAQVRKRPSHVTAVKNLFLAGDWTDTGLPATIEGAIRSGHRSAGLALNR